MMAAVAVCRTMRSLKPLHGSLRSLLRLQGAISRLRNYSTSNTNLAGPNFGLFFDIDGVIVRGRNLLPKAKEAFKLLTDSQGRFLVPTIFVTNAGNTLRANKAKQLSEWLDVEVHEDQVIMSHSPLKMFRQFFDKHVLVSGQGPVKEIATNLGFTRVTTIEKLRHCFPTLDTVDHKRRKSAPCGFESYFPKIDAVILFGEPVRWETNLQLILDVLLTDGRPAAAQPEISYPHIPILGCNMDLMWMAEAPMPRFGHGCFLNCLEGLYKKITGHELKYTALVGKPSEITYEHAENVLQAAATELGMHGISRMYCIGDNPDVDIYGANLYNRRIQHRLARRNDQQEQAAEKKRVQTASASDGVSEVSDITSDDDVVSGHDRVVGGKDQGAMDGEGGESRRLNWGNGGGLEGVVSVEECMSVLVCTGVYSDDRTYSTRASQRMLDHNHRDFIMDPDLKKPDMMVLNVYDAVQAILNKEYQS